ncbi:MAG: diguanylate cyclase [Firmicutes bacterium HGW-Firmicutes-7]|nr:MAG: diguanylate cyclase [Firmicutes bacterium HGW-Firmicutes-7]
MKGLYVIICSKLGGHSMKKNKDKRNIKSHFLLIAIGLIFYAFFVQTISLNATEDEKNVLFISSYSESFATVPDQIKGLHSVFDKQKVVLDIEYMDTKRFDTDVNKGLFYKMLKYKLDNLPPYDAIIVGDDNALQFAMDYQEELFNEIPIVFLGINDRERAEKANANKYMTGLIEEMSLVENIEIAYQFNPKAKRVFAIVDNTLTGQGDQRQFEMAKPSFPDLAFELLNVSEYTYETFGDRLQQVEQDTILLFLSMNQDSTGEYMDLEKEFLFLKDHTNVPVYRASIWGVGQGLMGGKMISYEAIGEISANLVMDIFSGIPVESFPLIEETPYYYVFDYNLIQRYQIDEALIPEGAVLINKENHPLEKYRKVIVAIGVVFVLLTILTVVFIIDNIRRRVIQRALAESNEELSAAYEELAASDEEMRIQYEIIQQHVQEVRILNKKYEIAIESTDSAVWEMDLETESVTISENFSNIVDKKVPLQENIFELLDLVVKPEYKEKIIQEYRNYLNGKIEEINIQVPTNDKGKTKKWLLIRGKGITDVKEDMKKMHGILLDITKMKEQEKYIEHLARHDYLTQLPNRLRFMEELDAELKNGKPGAVLLLDIDNFKRINDTLGHVYGDKLLKEISKRLSTISGDNMLIARLGGDEFLILVSNVSDSEIIDKYIEKIRSAFEAVFSVEGKDNYVNFSMGITCYPCDSNDINQLIMDADTAMYKVKNSGKNNHAYYYEAMKKEIKTKIKIENILRTALKEDRFMLLYQPQVEAQTGLIIGFEALLRLKDHQISPGEFIPIAEETGLIVEIGRWVAKEAVGQIASWRDKGYKEKIVAINFSSKQLRDKEYINFIKQLLTDYKVGAEFVEIEITENILLENNKQTLAFLQELKEAGLSIALDDFGTGYSSLNYLTYMPVDKIKLDKSINDKFLDFENNKVMDNLILLAHSLNLKITAEGIEEWSKFLKLQNGGCDYIQGYLFSKPLKREDIENIYNLNLIERFKDSQN